ncbi:hypothetical protein Q2T40_06090 [Winogradskyella maritima]|uniref:Uncharacterized protein n=1 Tax=Winogradskyella maritima TaxID=1517766 RepID=A0ABV8AMM0_9FLAO|nr:hypothetical protein [Winogradskyella maritima]
MNKIILVLSFICSTNLAGAQFGSRVLYKEQSSESFVPLKYITLKDSIGHGYGFPNPTGYKSIVFSESKPTEPKTKDWSVLQVKYVELYEEKSSNDLINLVFSKSQRDSIKANNERAKASFKIDTVKIFHLRKMRGGVADGLNTLLYKNDKARLFGSVVWDNYYAPHQLVFFQTTELPVYDSPTYFLNYNSHKAFKRAAKRVFKKCPKILSNIDNGDYFPKHKSNLKKFADDYALLCAY